MNIKVDARGLQCPKPVIETKKALNNIGDEILTTIVDNEVAKENVKKLAISMDYMVDIIEDNNEFHLNISKDLSRVKLDNIDMGNDKLSKKENANHVILIGKDKMGEGDEVLGNILMKGYIYSLTECEPYPKALLFVNSGVNLTIDESEVLDHLKVLQDKGIELLSCGTCLDFYGYKDRLAIGEVTNMYTIVELTSSASNTITI